MGIPKQFSILVAFTEFLTFFKSPKIITCPNLDSINFNNDFKDNFMQEKVNKMASKAKILIFSRLSLTENEFRMT